jgi:hypothetical protein
MSGKQSVFVCASREPEEEEKKEKVINLLSGNNSATSDLLAVSNVYDVELSWLSASSLSVKRHQF